MRREVGTTDPQLALPGKFKKGIYFQNKAVYHIKIACYWGWLSTQLIDDIGRCNDEVVIEKSK
jgi:hypothetical protein